MRALGHGVALYTASASAIRPKAERLATTACWAPMPRHTADAFLLPVPGGLAAWCAGVALVQTFAALPRPAWWPLAGALVLFGGSVALRTDARRDRAASRAIALAACMLAGVAYGTWRAELRLADALPLEWEGEDVAIVGVVDELPRATERGVRFVLAVERALTPGAQVPRRVSLAWVVGFPDAERGVVVPEVRAGERWQLVVRLQRPHGLANPGGFDLEAWLLERGLRATGYVRVDEANRRIDAFAGRPMDHVQRLREAIRERIHAALPGAALAGVLVALAIGDQSGIAEAQWTVFNRTGTGHLVSVSGLHVTVFALLAGALAYALARRVTRLTSLVPARKVAALVGLAASAGYVQLAGAEVPAQRTLYMLAVATLGLWLARPGSGYAIWLAALATVLAIDPWAVLGPGFWLSFLAVGVLIYAGSARLPEFAREGGLLRRAWRSLADAARAQWAITVGLVPITLLLFGHLSIVGPLANALAIPAVTFAIVPVTLTAALLAPLPLWPVAHALLALLMQVLEPLAQAPGAAWAQHRPLPAALPFAAFGVVLALAPRGVPGRWLGFVSMLPLFLLVPPRPPPGAFRVVVLDVGQGTAVVVETHSHVLLYDTGPRWNESADAGSRVVVPVLRAAGLRTLDAMVVSHRDLDHAGGALSVLQQVPVAALLSSLDDAHPVVERQRERGAYRRCERGQGWWWDGVRFDMLFPEPRHYDDPMRKANDLSCVVRVAGAHGVALLAGDVEAVSEMALVLDASEALRADLLLAPHHGSRTSSTPAFVAAVAARDVVFTVGHRNRFGHPRANVVERYVRRGAAVHRTDHLGALTFRFAAPGPGPPLSERARSPRYWHDPP